jgi:3-oxoacyl-[acyl-carrier-protein] synthase II
MEFNRVAVTGMGAVTPIGNNVGAFWKGLVSGKNGIGEITKFDAAGYKAKLAAELKDFDPLSVMDKAGVRKTDPFTQYALCAAEEAVGDSEIAGKIDGAELGVYFGSGVGGFQTFCDEHQALLEGGPRKVSPHFIPKMTSNIAAGNIAIRWGAHGPCVSVTTACATASSAIGEAYRAIRHGYAKAVICGGSEAAITPLGVAGFINCMALSEAEDPNAASLPFDRRRGGFVMGEGAAALVLEDYGHAVRRGAKIYAEVCGYGATCDAYHITAPNPDVTASAKAVRDALAGVGEVDASRIYINAHGTGTKLNDRTETALIKRAFGADAARLHISSTKSMTGHMLGASGAAEAIAAILAMRDGIIPPTINLMEPDEECDLDYTPLWRKGAISTRPYPFLSASAGTTPASPFKSFEPEEAMDLKQISELLKLFSENGLKRLDLSEGDLKLVLEAHSRAEYAGQTGKKEPRPSRESASGTGAEAAEEDGFIQTSPVVGTVYLSAEPGTKPFAAIGDAVTVGQTICIVEAMKMYSNLEARAAGVIEEIYVENGQPVGVGQALFKISGEGRRAS